MHADTTWYRSVLKQYLTIRSMKVSQVMQCMIAPCTNQLQEHATLTLSVRVQRLSKIVPNKQKCVVCLLRHQWRIQRGFHGFYGTPLLKGCLQKYYAQTYYVHKSTLTLDLLHSSNNACVSPHSCIKNSTRAWPTCTYNERSEQVN